MLVVAQCRTRVNGLTRIVDHVAPSPAMKMRCIALVRIMGIAKTQISVCQSRLKEIAQLPVFHIVETMIFNAKIQLMVMDVELILAAYTMIQLLFARPSALFNVPKMNGLVRWDMMILDAQHLKAVLLMVSSILETKPTYPSDKNNLLDVISCLFITLYFYRKMS